MRNIIICILIVQFNILSGMTAFAREKNIYTHSSFKKEVRRLIRSSGFRGRTGIYAKFLRGSHIVSFNSKIAMTPASCTKILTTSAVLRHMKLNYKFKTEFLGNYKGMEMTTPLYWRGNGDPSMDLKDLSDMISSLKAKGIRKISKGVVIDDFYFIKKRPKGFRKNARFEGYMAPPYSVTVNSNSISVILRRKGNTIDVECYPPSEFVECISKVKTGIKNYDLRVASYKSNGKIKVVAYGKLNSSVNKYVMRAKSLDSTKFAAGVLIQELKSHGIIVTSKYKRRRTPKNVGILVVHKSKKLKELVKLTNKYSNNFYAENLLRALGAFKYGAPGTTSKGLKVVYALMNRSGIKNGFNISNGSGLFGTTKVAPYHFVKYMERLNTIPWLFKAVSESLAIPGQDGTLYNRLIGGNVRYHLHAKTGTLNNASCLTGILKQGRKTILFSIINDNFTGQLRSARVLQNRVVKLLNRLLIGKISIKGKNQKKTKKRKRKK